VRIYLDTCCLQRSLDDQAHPRVKVETAAVFAVLAGVLSGQHVLLGSEALDYEIARIPDPTRRAEAFSVLTGATEYLRVTAAVETLAFQLEYYGIGAMDAVHLALASVAKVDYFCTCDDKLFRKAVAVSGLTCKIISLLGLVSEVTP
jgi:predicted nucleic acid-binding protein